MHASVRVQQCEDTRGLNLKLSGSASEKAGRYSSARTETAALLLAFRQGGGTSASRREEEEKESRLVELYE